MQEAFRIAFVIKYEVSVLREKAVKMKAKGIAQLSQIDLWALRNLNLNFRKGL